MKPTSPGFSVAACVLCTAILCPTALAGEAKKRDPEKKPEHARELEAANKLFEEGKYEEAEKAYRELEKKDTEPSTWGKVVFNLGLALARQKRYQQAIREFLRVIVSKVDDKEAGGDIMEAYRNYRHRACLEIAECYEAQKDYVTALTYAEMARDKHKYQSWCGTCAQGARRALDEYIEKLKAKLR